jgi:DNA-binding beta-propeller fold protein YncE
VFVRKWGTSGTGDGQFDGPWSVAVAPDGSVYVVDRNNHRIQKFTSEGVFVTKWGTVAEGTGDGEFGHPNGVAVAPDGSIYVADVSNYRIQKFSVGQ